ncbi:dienelactone hydrolase family protein [Mariprofundus sp. EBB-1]|uniref:dienelactone hydrolase family protein n=1 Tax=Mariprofundus sp. EBB-1 TaxID=2650971 RepID=UPI001911ECC9|nr:dienelactone hydrolase family protein [Mariprofundus sp. EBB-1]
MQPLYTLLSILMLVWMPATVYAEVQDREIIYQVDGVEFTGYLAFDDAIPAKRPGILVLHEWWGHNAYARKRADMLAALGYTAFALDMYGTGKLATHPEDAKRFMLETVGDVAVVKARFEAALNTLLDHASVDPEKVAAIGYCMGGGIALNMARAGVNLDGVAIFHGSLGTQSPVKAGKIKAAIMVFTGAADSFVPQAQVQAFEQEMQAADVDYRLVSYPGVKHSFTNPEADIFARQFNMPLAYNRVADEDSWQQLQQFLNRIFK